MRKIKRAGRTASGTTWASTSASSKYRGKAAAKGRGITGHSTRPVRICLRRGTTGGAGGWSGPSDPHQLISNRGNPCSEETATATCRRLSTSSPASWTTPGPWASRPLRCPTRLVRWPAVTSVRWTSRGCQLPRLTTLIPGYRAWPCPAWWTLTTAWVTITTQHTRTMRSSWARPPRRPRRSPPATERAFSSPAPASPRSSPWCTARTGNTKLNTRRYTRGLIFKTFPFALCVTRTLIQNNFVRFQNKIMHVDACLGPDVEVMTTETILPKRNPGGNAVNAVETQQVAQHLEPFRAPARGLVTGNSVFQP